MPSQQTNEHFNQIHIDIARNATDDFNLFHDSHRWSDIVRNPFNGAIALGFQVEALIEQKVYFHRLKNNENRIITQEKLNFSNYQFSFANAIKPGEAIEVNIKKTSHSAGFSNRISVKANNKLALIGFKKETQEPLFLADSNLSDIYNELGSYPDRSFFSNHNTDYFLKRKFMNVSNAKNFLCGTLTDQRIYFNELENKYNFPEIFPCSFISCALLEKSLLEGLNFKTSPMVYRSHKISIDRLLLSQLKSNDILHILISQQKEPAPTPLVQSFACYGIIKNNKILFRAIVELTPLDVILKIITAP
ncbi:MAG: hypothetical protein GY694_18365 [Gammaproteobacteria bacterium]|nr:hypothetical protein [Gammaproteobacteria bacterium]